MCGDVKKAHVKNEKDKFPHELTVIIAISKTYILEACKTSLVKINK